MTLRRKVGVLAAWHLSATPRHQTGIWVQRNAWP